MTPFQRTLGPACQYCGCTETFPTAKTTGLFSWGGKGTSRYGCRNCHRLFAVERTDEEEVAEPAEEPAAPDLGPKPVYFHVVRCPRCSSARTKITSSPKSQGSSRIRYHKCLDCEARGEQEKTFKSVEAE